MQQGSILPFLKNAGPPRLEGSGSGTSRSEGSLPKSSRPGQPYQSRNSSSSSEYSGRSKERARHNSSNKHRAPDRRRNMDLKLIADETKAELPNVILQIPNFDAMESSVYALKDLQPIEADNCPGFILPDDDADGGRRGTRIKVFDMDTFDAAIDLAPGYTASVHVELQSRNIKTDSQEQDGDQVMGDASQYNDQIMKDQSQSSQFSSTHIPTSKTTDINHDTRHSPPSHNPKPVAVLNLASERSPGGGWQNGALAQEEALCYRSSLYLSLHDTYYRLPSLSAIYSPSVLIIRDAMSRGHTLLVPPEQPANLPVTSVISVAALRYPALTQDGRHFKNEFQRAETKRKIRLTLRLAAAKGHTKLVLGALGCGVFANPPKEVAKCFLEVLREKEFQGGWWEEVVFAILDNVNGENGGKDGVGNYGQFWRVLDGQVV